MGALESEESVVGMVDFVDGKKEGFRRARLRGQFEHTDHLGRWQKETPALSFAKSTTIADWANRFSRHSTLL
jgi:hypothetical protein